MRMKDGDQTLKHVFTKLPLQTYNSSSHHNDTLKDA